MIYINFRLSSHLDQFSSVSLPEFLLIILLSYVNKFFLLLWTIALFVVKLPAEGTIAGGRESEAISGENRLNHPYINSRIKFGVILKAVHSTSHVKQHCLSWRGSFAPCLAVTTVKKRRSPAYKAAKSHIQKKSAPTRGNTQNYKMFRSFPSQKKQNYWGSGFIF